MGKRKDLPGETQANKCRAGIQTPLRFIALQTPKRGPPVTVMVALQAQGQTREKLFRSEDGLPVLPLTELTLMHHQGPLLSTQSPSWGPFQCVSLPLLPFLWEPPGLTSPQPLLLFSRQRQHLSHTPIGRPGWGADSSATATNRKPERCCWGRGHCRPGPSECEKPQEVLRAQLPLPHPFSGLVQPQEHSDRNLLPL